MLITSTIFERTYKNQSNNMLFHDQYHIAVVIISDNDDYIHYFKNIYIFAVRQQTTKI